MMKIEFSALVVPGVILSFLDVSGSESQKIVRE
jgi:hypothetical protein